jgi:beta-ureidopropionase
MNRYDMPPRKVVVATVMGGLGRTHPGLDARLDRLSELIDKAAAEARRKYPQGRLDLVVLPENAVTTGRSGTARERSEPLEGKVLDTFAAKAREHQTYLVVTLNLAEGDAFYNAAVLIGRDGAVAGIYRKIHPVAYVGRDTLEQGITPGAEVPVFECDFGRLGIQICWDMVYDDGWDLLRRKGAEIVVWPSASPATAQPARRAWKGGYYIVSSTFRENSSIYAPTGLIAAQVREDGGVLVEQLDLSYLLLHWSEQLLNGTAFRKRFGDRVGFRYDPQEDLGIFWSNDPDMPIGEMARQIGVDELHFHIERNRSLQDAARGGAIR